MKRMMSWLMLSILLLSLAGCGADESHVFVQKVATLASMGGIAPADRFAGIVVSENVTKIEKDEGKEIGELYVEKGDEVYAGQPLFTYDTEQLTLTLEKQRLELEQLRSSIESYTEQIAQLEKDRERAYSGDKLKYTLQIQTSQIDLKEAELKLKTKQSEVQKSEHLLENAVVTAPVDGRITALGEEQQGSEYGQSTAYITIQQTGAYRIRGILNEMQRGTIVEGERIRVESRLDSSEFWMGTVTLVDYENPTQGNSSGFVISGNSDGMDNSSRYPFYIELDSSENLLLGQHVYLSVQYEQPTFQGLALSSAFVAYDPDGACFVWAEGANGRLEKRTVELGTYDEYSDMYEVLSGLTEADYIAFPDDSVCTPGAPTTRTE